MKQPRLSDLEMDAKNTERIRAKMSSGKKIKITINIDQDSLKALRLRSGETGVPYQRLLNQMLKEALERNVHAASRLERLERELEKLKRRLAA